MEEANHYPGDKSEQNCSTMILPSAHGGKTSFLLIFCSGVLTTLNLLKEFFHTIQYRADKTLDSAEGAI
jgi:low temperature requirement protein LtrA